MVQFLGSVGFAIPTERARRWPRRVLSPPRLAATTLGAALLVALVTLVVATASVDAGSGDRPNLVLIIADDLGYGETGMMGNVEIPTPAIDALASGGVRCTAGYVTSSYCSPSRAGLMTGRYQSRFGYDWNPTGKRNAHPNAGLPEDQPTFIDRLSDAGYSTALMGKWHLGTRSVQVPTAKGFDEFFGFLHEGHYYVPGPPYQDVWTMVRDTSLQPGQRVQDEQTFRGNYARISEPEYDADNPIQAGDQTVIETQYLTDAISRRAVDFIETPRDRPFALVVSYNAVHSPMQAANTDYQRFAKITDPHRRIFAGMLAALDRGVGQITEALDRGGIAEETLVVFLSDNGGPTAELTSSNAPLRAGKGTLYEGGVRIPMVWRMPGTLAAGIEPRPVLSLDIAATFLAMASVDVPADSIDGVDVASWLGDANRDTPSRPIWWRMPRGAKAMRWKNQKIVMPARSDAFQLYDLVDDPGETQDLARQRPEQVATMEAIWNSLDRAMIPTKPLN